MRGLYSHRPPFFGKKAVAEENGFYNLFWGAKVTVQIRVLSASTFFNKKIGICTQILYN